MQKLIVLTLLSISGTAFADVKLSKLAGSYQSGCIQTQVTGKQGSVVEAYAFTASGNYEFTRSWFKASDCAGEAFEQDQDSGTFKIGKENTNHGFNPAGTYEVEYKNKTGSDLGLLWISDDSSKVRVARGLSAGVQNTMLGLTQYFKK